MRARAHQGAPEFFNCFANGFGTVLRILYQRCEGLLGIRGLHEIRCHGLSPFEDHLILCPLEVRKYKQVLIILS